MTIDCALGLIEHLKSFSGFGPVTQCFTRGEIPYFENQFWTAKQRQSHALHEISYRACFKAELPAFFIDLLSNPDDIIYDPFSGRGTTVVEAALKGRRALGNDVNPLFPMLCRPRLNTPCLEAIEDRLAAVNFQRVALPELGQDPTTDDLLAFYHPSTLRQLLSLRYFLWEGLSLYSFDDVDDWIRMVALNRLSGHSAGYFSAYTLPPNQATNPVAQRRINLKYGPPQPRDVAKLIMRKSRSLLRDGSLKTVFGEFLERPASNTPEIPDGSVALTVTSPPFLDVVRYDIDNWLRFWFAQIDPTKVAMTHLKDPSDWAAEMRSTLIELCRVTRPGGFIAFEVGDVRGGKICLEEIIWKQCENIGLERIGVLVNRGDFTKTAQIWNVSNNKLGTNSNRVVLLRKLEIA